MTWLPAAREGEVIVCEATGRWATVLKRVLAHENVRLVETRTSGQCREALDRSPASPLVLELTPVNAEGALALVAAVERQFPAACVIVVTEPEMAGLEWIARELGAVHFVTATRQMKAVAEIVRRRQPSRGDASGAFIDSVLAEVPWASKQTGD